MSTDHHIVAADAKGVAETAAALTAGKLAAFPTETVYGLGADATNDEAVAAIFAAKDRPDFNPLIVHTADMESAGGFVAFNAMAKKLAARFWPGALSMVLPRRADSGLSQLVSAGLDTVAVRVPSHPIAREMLAQCNCPVAAPSANRSGQISPTEALHVAQSLPGPGDGGPAIILDAGACPVGLESTVIDLSTQRPSLLRPGGIPIEELQAVTGSLVIAGSDDQTPKSPGMLSRHYAPATPLRLNATTPENGEALLAFGSSAEGATLNLSAAEDLREAAANLFSMLHRLDAEGHTGIAVAAIPEHGLGRAINDRLRRAASVGEEI